MKILVVGPAWVGDMVMAQTLFQLLKSRQPDCIIDVLAPAWTEPLLARMPQVRRAIALPLKHGEFNWRARHRIGRSLRAERYDQAIVLPNSWKSAFVPFFARIPRRTGFRGEFRYGLLNDLRILNKEKLPLMIQRFLALGIAKDDPVPDKSFMPALKVQDAEVSETLKIYHLSRDQKILALCPGAEFGPAKCWPPEYFAKTAAHYLEQGWQVWIFGSKNDIETARRINIETKQRCVNLTGKTTLAEAIDLLSCASAVVTNDSGLMHVACALQLPVVAVYGSSSPAFTPPLSQRAKILSLNLECSPCFQRVCPLTHFRCMRDLKPELVIGELEQLKV